MSCTTAIEVTCAESVKEVAGGEIAVRVDLVDAAFTELQDNAFPETTSVAVPSDGLPTYTVGSHPHLETPLDRFHGTCWYTMCTIIVYIYIYVYVYTCMYMQMYEYMYTCSCMCN